MKILNSFEMFPNFNKHLGINKFIDILYIVWSISNQQLTIQANLS